MSSGREIELPRDVARYLPLTQFALELFGWRSGLHTWPGIITIGFDIPVYLVEWPGSGGGSGGLCDGFRKFGGMCRIWEGEEVRMIKSL